MVQHGYYRLAYSHGGMTFKTAGAWIDILREYERLQEELINKKKISWSFNLPKASWQAGHYKGVIEISENTFSKIRGKQVLPFEQQKKVVTDAKMLMKNSRELKFNHLSLLRKE